MPSRLAMSSWKWFLLSFFGGGIVFWIPDLVIPALDHTEGGGAVTFACPALLILYYMILWRLRKPERLGPSIAIFATCGMWVFALSFTLLAQWIRSERGLGPLGWGDIGYLVISSFMPNRIFELVSLEGSIFALLIGTAAMIFCLLAALASLRK
jgi:apolipoprotein N-acyltransferase